MADKKGVEEQQACTGRPAHLRCTKLQVQGAGEALLISKAA